MTALRPVRRTRRVVLPLALCLGLAAALTSCAEDPDEGTNGVGRLPANEIEDKARVAADGAVSVRLAGSLVSKSGTYRLNMRLKARGATGSVTTRKSTFELLRIGDALFLKAGAAFWRHAQDSGEPTESDIEAADKLDGKYVKVPQDDPSYKQLRGFTEMNVLLKGLLTIHGEVRKGDRDKVGGVRTIEVAGGEHGEGGTLDVSLEGTPFPLQFARGGGGGEVVLSDWNEDFPLVEPEKEEILDYGRQLPRTSG
ncbi:hypothetical protein [Streptomyces somaliensis]|uniref:Lipoprotein n=1 Tax=Streptomyces somaliensis (strain ATCC 33201 / DSM 40738 / JCM 12659 / KCTC 9044 / NCTC 11332 / NRRL B-12077 / IP 733) TaxID=1134445 RepID=A0AA44DE24_STRE0|nr:hypothetical protein [Streptomyces somaliensis DSM 40738]